MRGIGEAELQTKDTQRYFYDWCNETQATDYLSGAPSCRYVDGTMCPGLSPFFATAMHGI